MRYFVTGIGTNVGKTVVSAVLVEALEADYWKPIQCGYPRDLDTVRSLVSNRRSKFWPEHVLLKEPASPHQAAHMEQTSLSIADMAPPSVNHDIIVEGAGGIMVPLNNEEYMIDMLQNFTDQVIVVIRLYLGCINHSLLTLDLLKNKGVTIKGLVFNGPSNVYSQQAIKNCTQAPTLLHIPQVDNVDQKQIRQWAQELNKQWN